MTIIEEVKKELLENLNQNLFSKGELVEYIKDTFNKLELEFYSNDMKDIKIDLGSEIPNYDTLVESLEISEVPIEDKFNFVEDTQSIHRFQNHFSTGISGLHFVREEIFYDKDEDIMKCYLLFSKDNL